MKIQLSVAQENILETLEKLGGWTTITQAQLESGYSEDCTAKALTTNQTKANGDSFDIDPAILSRCSAVFTFELPQKRESTEIWMIQAKTMGIELSTDIIKHVVNSYALSGRSIRNLLKLASSWAEHRGEELSTVHFDKAVKFLPKTRNEVVKDAK